MTSIELSKKHKDFAGMRLCGKALNEKEEDRPYASVIQIQDGIATATDGHRLCRYTLAEGLPNGYYVVETNNQNKMVLTPISFELSYPDAEPVLSQSAAYRIECDRVMLVDRLRKMRVLVDEYYKGLKLTLTQNLLKMKIINPDLGDAETKMPVKYDGKELEIGFNVDYLLDVVNFMKSRMLVLEVTDVDSPMFFKGGDDPRFVGAVMPMRI